MITFCARGAAPCRGWARTHANSASRVEAAEQNNPSRSWMSPIRFMAKIPPGLRARRAAAKNSLVVRWKGTAMTPW